jgi:hypothetical protein
MRNLILVLAMIIIVPVTCSAGAAAPVMFASYAGDAEQLRHTLVLVESIRTFGGRFADAPVRIYAPSSLMKTQEKLVKSFSSLEAEVRSSDAPADARAIPFAGKVFAAMRAEKEAKGAASILVWMDEDTVVLAEPGELALAKSASLGYRPVMHRNIGSLYSEKPDAFWSHVYEKLAVPASAVFPMKTVTGDATVRAYFNAGLLAVRPERGIMKRWVEAFATLYLDPTIAGMCKKDQRLGVFLHQAALSAAVVKHVPRNEMTPLPASYNYPIFFKEMYGADKPYDSIAGVVTIRYDVYFKNPAPDWSTKLKGPEEKVSWLETHLGAGSGAKKNADTKLRYKFQSGGKAS